MYIYWHCHQWTTSEWPMSGLAIALDESFEHFEPHTLRPYPLWSWFRNALTWVKWWHCERKWLLGGIGERKDQAPSRFHRAHHKLAYKRTAGCCSVPPPSLPPLACFRAVYGHLVRAEVSQSLEAITCHVGGGKTYIRGIDWGPLITDGPDVCVYVCVQVYVYSGVLVRVCMRCLV